MLHNSLMRHDHDYSMLHIVSFSGGKDSVATWLYLRSLGVENIKCVFADTGHESPVTYQYLDYLIGEGCPLVKIHPIHRDLRKNWPDVADRDWLDSQMTMESLCAFKKRFPSPTRRFCTTFLKLAPIKRFIDQYGTDEIIMVCGVRAQESPKRAAMTPWAMDDYMGVYRWLPIHDWTYQQVFKIHDDYGIEPNPLYKQGFSRVGCWPCIMARKSELNAMATIYPEAFDRLAEMEKRAAKHAKKCVLTFFSCTDVPKHYRSTLDPKSGKMVCTADDVRRWALSQGPHGEIQSDFFDEGDDIEAPTCSSPYGLCE